jgi:hypothetical protein
MGLLTEEQRKKLAGLLSGNAQQIYQGLLSAPKDLAQINSPAMTARVNQAMTNPQPITDADKQAMLGAGMELSGMAPTGGLLTHTVYHGSPHKFDKFDMSKIGTGEGAQAYGHGLYMAESPEVAKTYGRSTTPGNRAFNSVRYNGQEFPAGSRDGEMLYDITTKGRAEVIQNLQNQADRLATINPKESENLLNRIEYAKTIKPDNVQIDAGNLYKVDIPDEAIPRMLDWDKPLSEQAPEVQAAAMKIAGPKLQELAQAQQRYIPGVQPLDTMTGEEFIRHLNQGTRGTTEGALQQAGIPGIRYLDAASRTPGEGTSNYVLFDDQMPRILEMNGQPTGLLSYADEAKAATQANQVAPPYLNDPRYPRIDSPTNTPTSGQSLLGDTYAGYPTLEAYQAKLAADEEQANRIRDAYSYGDSLTARYGIPMARKTHGK